eukprot:GHVL01010281.1.p1 GENE.GHVL01010281.1~~GHVL01010281.1.p1  ORF type:complete len:2039 (-),score=264.23 GHVL01010281.1:149-5695(-)
MIIIAFMSDKAGIMSTFEVNRSILSEQGFIFQLSQIRESGVPVLLSVRLADIQQLLDVHEDAFVHEIVRLANKYGFDGLDVMFDGDCGGEEVQKPFLRNVIKRVVNYFALQTGGHFIVTLSPTFQCLLDEKIYHFGLWLDEVDYDLLQVQYYGQGNAGLTLVGDVGCDDETAPHIELSQNIHGVKQDFLFYLTESILSGTRGFMSVPSDKLLIGLPANADAASDGDVMDRFDLVTAISRLNNQNLFLRGLMTWSMNWDNGTSADGTPYNWGFVAAYYDFILSGTPAIAPIHPKISELAPSQIIFGGIWDNRCADFPFIRGKKEGWMNCVEPKNIHSLYNVVMVGYITSSIGQTLTFSINDRVMYEVEFFAQAQEMRNQGVVFLLSLSRRLGLSEIADYDVERYFNEITTVLIKYGFDGLDIEFTSSQDWGVPAMSLIMRIVDFFNYRQQSFIVSLSASFMLLQDVQNTVFKSFMDAIDYEFAHIWYYRDEMQTEIGGVYVNGVFISQEDNTRSEDFVFYLTDSIIHGTRDYLQIPKEKLVIGLASNEDAVVSGYVEDRADVLNALWRLTEQKTMIRGLMASSLSWENGQRADGSLYDWEFADRYGLTKESFFPFPKKVFGARWNHYNCGEMNIAGATELCIDPRMSDNRYNLILISTNKVFNNIPTLESDPEIVRIINEFHEAGKPVLLTIKDHDYKEVSDTHIDSMKEAIIYLTDAYRFDGIDIFIDLECSPGAAFTSEAMLKAVEEVVLHYQKMGHTFLVSLSPKFQCLKHPYSSIFSRIYTIVKGWEHIVQVRYYNQNSDGVDVDGFMLAQNNEAAKEAFLYYMTDSILEGSRGLEQVNGERLVIELPVNSDATVDGFVENKSDLYYTLFILNQSRLSAENVIRGLTGTTMNWETSIRADGSKYHSQFAEDYANFVQSPYAVTPTPPPFAELPATVISTTWMESGPSEGAEGGILGSIGLNMIHQNYNVVKIWAMQPQDDGAFAFRLQSIPDEEMQENVNELKMRGVAVLVSLFDSEHRANLDAQGVDGVVTSIILDVYKYGFQGVDVVFNSARDWASSSIVLTEALKRVRQYFANLGHHFTISFTAFYDSFSDNTRFRTFVQNLDYHVDLFYVKSFDKYSPTLTIGTSVLRPNEIQRQEDWYYYMLLSIISGDESLIKNQSFKLILELPANGDAATIGNMVDLKNIENVVARLEGISPIRGLSSWSVNWDVGTDKYGKSFDFLFAISFGTLKTAANALDLPREIKSGYWINNCEVDLTLTVPPCLSMDAVDPSYNVVFVAFAEIANASDRIPSFTVNSKFSQMFIEQVTRMKRRGVNVMLSLRESDIPLNLVSGDEDDFYNMLLLVTEQLRFSGVDIYFTADDDFEAGDTPNIIINALKRVKDYNKILGHDFKISLSPSFAHLHIANAESSMSQKSQIVRFKKYLDGLESYYDFVQVYYYNQGDRGVQVYYYNQGGVQVGSEFLHQNDNMRKEDFVYYMTDSIVHGSRDFTLIPSDKLVIGLPTSWHAVSDGYVDENDLLNALSRLNAQNTPVRGLMWWNLNMKNYSAAPELQAEIKSGYWMNECNVDRSNVSHPPCLSLDKVDPSYNMILVAFMEAHNGPIPTFQLNEAIMTENRFIEQIRILNKQGVNVLLSLSEGATPITLARTDEDAFYAEVIRLTDKYGFNGIDLYFKTDTDLDSGDTATVISNALKRVKEHYRTNGDDFKISLSPPFSRLHNTQIARFLKYIYGLEGYYDVVQVYYYNQGNQGINVKNIIYAQNDDSVKETFLFFLTDAIMHGTKFYRMIPREQLILGLPTSEDAVIDGYVRNPVALSNAINRLKAQNTPLRGFMGWNINWEVANDTN